MGQVSDSLRSELGKQFSAKNAFKGEGLDILTSIKSSLPEGEVEEKWSEKYKRSIDCKNPKGFSQRAHCQGKKKKSETKEATGTGGASGAFEAPLGFKNSKFVERSFAETPRKAETKEATGSGSSGSYETPAAWAKSTKKKDWRGKSKTQIPGGKFVTVKKKCKSFPYCNQGDIKALKIYENEVVKKVIKKISSEHNISENVIKAIIQYEIENYKNKTIN
jgi:hypothetical protein